MGIVCILWCYFLVYGGNDFVFDYFSLRCNKMDILDWYICFIICNYSFDYVLGININKIGYIFKCFVIIVNERRSFENGLKNEKVLLLFKSGFMLLKYEVVVLIIIKKLLVLSVKIRMSVMKIVK